MRHLYRYAANLHFRGRVRRTGRKSHRDLNSCNCPGIVHCYKRQMGGLSTQVKPQKKFASLASPTSRVHLMKIVRSFFPALAALLVTAALGAQTPTGTITGRVADSTTHQPLTGGSLLIEGTKLGTVTAGDGTFRLNNVPSGSITVQARRIGYNPQ